jgi:hypothetical protein
MHRTDLVEVEATGARFLRPTKTEVRGSGYRAVPGVSLGYRAPGPVKFENIVAAR